MKLLLFFIFVLFSSLSFADNIINEYKSGDISGVFKYRPINIEWVNIPVIQDSYYDYLLAANIVLKLKKCEYSQIPVKVVYNSDILGYNLSGFFIINPAFPQDIYIKIIKLKNLSGNVIFSHIEIDSIFRECFLKIDLARFNFNPFFYNVMHSNLNEKRIIPAGYNILYFKNLLSNNIKLNSDGLYTYKGMIGAINEVRSIDNWYKICSSSSLNTFFEKSVLGRAIVCGITDDIATNGNVTLKKGESIYFDGEIFSGSIFLIISRKNGGIVKVLTLNRGSFFESINAPISADYIITLSSNISRYNYPYLFFNFRMIRVN